MISDDERREVVARLREWLAIPWYKRPLRRDAMQSIGEMVGAVPGEDIVERIADLIDRPTCRNVSGCQDVFECSECRCRAELVTEVCNEHGNQFHVPLMPSYCPNCGAVVVEKEEDNG